MSFPGADAPSKRTPSSPTWLNAADGIERGLREDGHHIWGFVVYRTATATYSDSDEDDAEDSGDDKEEAGHGEGESEGEEDEEDSGSESDDDAAWSRLLATLATCARRSLDVYNGLDLLDSFRLTVVEEPELEDATSAAVRAHFATWCGEGATGAAAREQGDGVTAGLSQRYRFCIWVDDEALDSFRLDGDDESDEGENGYGDEVNDDMFVNLIWKDWEPSRPDPREPPVEPAIEGSTRPDVGWMRVAVSSVPVVMYELLREENSWYGEYRRPPEVVCR